MPPLVFVAGLILVLVAAAILVQAFILPAARAPAGAPAGTVPPAIGPDVATTTAVLMTISPELHTIKNTSGFSAPVDTAPGTPPPSGPATGLTGSPSYAWQNHRTGSNPEVPVITASSLEARVHILVNRVREDHGLPALGTDAALVSLARAHSADMAEKRYFGHVNLDERDATARGAAAGYSCHKDADPYYSYAIAENLYATERYSPAVPRDGRATGYAWTTEEAMAEEAVEAWMNSPDHRDNILDPGMGREGIGVAIAEYGLVFITQNFC
jgi:uncharacterized protein YkwD